MRQVVIALAVLAVVILAVGPVFTAPADIDAGAAATDTADRGEQMQINDPPTPPLPFTATYRVTISLAWTSSTHPGFVPPNPHISPPVAAVHSVPNAMFGRGALASPGIEIMAEQGGTNTLRAELAANPQVGDVDVTSGINGSGSVTLTLTTDQTMPFLSIVSMLAPSPDWFVGRRNIEVFTGDGWLVDALVPMANYDAGTDSGATFTAANADTQPPLPISGPRDQQFIDAVQVNPAVDGGANRPFAFARIQLIG